MEAWEVLSTSQPMSVVLQSVLVGARSDITQELAGCAEARTLPQSD